MNITGVCESAYMEEESRIEDLFCFASDTYNEFCDIWCKQIGCAEDDMRNGGLSNGNG